MKDAGKFNRYFRKSSQKNGLVKRYRLCLTVSTEKIGVTYFNLTGLNLRKFQKQYEISRTTLAK